MFNWSHNLEPKVKQIFKNNFYLNGNSGIGLCNEDASILLLVLMTIGTQSWNKFSKKKQNFLILAAGDHWMPFTITYYCIPGPFLSIFFSVNSSWA